jgi:hypothetical protein
LLLAVGLGLFFVAYLGYAEVLESVDGLPPLPDAYRPRDTGQSLTVPAPLTTKVDEMLQMAFGSGAAELKRPIRIGTSSRGVYFAAETFRFESDGRVRLEPVSLAIIKLPDSKTTLARKTNPGSKALPDPYPEINTLRAKLAYLTFDRPIHGPKDLDKRKIVAAELSGDIKLVHNRKTPQQDDDIDVRIANGPVFFEDAKHLIYTSDDIELKDMQSKPEPIKVTATGMEIHLTGSPTSRAGSKHTPRPKAEKEPGIDRIVLRSNVDMDLYLDSRSGFLAPSRPLPGGKGEGDKPAADPRGRANKPAATRNLPAGHRDHVHIRTSGPFSYNLQKNFARFDIPDNPKRQFAEQIDVIRNPELKQQDHLVCEHLELQFRRKNAETNRPGNSEDSALDLEIETAHATGKEVTLTSDAESLDAYGNDLFYDARTRQTILKGDPEMRLFKEGNEIHAPELEIVDQKGAQQVSARGAGRFHLLDKRTGKRTMHARWKEKFVSSRDGPDDLLTLHGDAAFIQDERLSPEDLLQEERILSAHTLLQADEIQVWLEGRPLTTPTPPPQEANTLSGRKPRKLEANGHVLARSPELIIHDADKLLILFRNAPTPTALPGPRPVAALTSYPQPLFPQGGGGPASLTPSEGNVVGGPGLATSKPADPLATIRPAPSRAGEAVAVKPGQARPDPNAKPPRPIDLSARLVKAYVVRSNQKNELDELRTEGAVRVIQAPASLEEKGVDISGDTLKLKRQPGGNLLVVTGDLAQLRMDKLFIIGPEINIDQALNTAWVNGNGAIQMETTTDFQGGKLSKPVPLEVHWNKRMDFDGDSIEFHGGIQAEQSTSRLACESLHVYLDRPVSLKEGNKSGTPARARKLTGDRNVRVEEKVLQPPETGQLAAYRRLDCLELTVNNEEGTVHAPGPGWVRLAQPGSSELSPGPSRTRESPPPPSRSIQPGAEAWKLTLVSYFKLMSADNKNRTATFWEDVRLLHVPWDREKATQAVDFDRAIDQMPPGGLYLRSDRLTVYSRLANTRNGQQMDAQGRVDVKARDARGQEFWGNADSVHYDEEKDQVIFEGGEGGKARLTHVEYRGAIPRTVTGKKILYLRSKGECIADGVTEIRGSN